MEGRRRKVGEDSALKGEVGRAEADGGKRRQECARMRRERDTEQTGARN